jgi:hypothetical protein
MQDNEGDEIEREERAIYWIITVALSPILVGVFVEGVDLEGGNALSLLLVALGIAGLFAGFRALAARRLPAARIHRR